MKNKISKVVSGALILFSGILTNWVSSNPKSLYLPAIAFCIWGSWMILAGVHTYVSKQEKEKAAEVRSLQGVPVSVLLSEGGRTVTTESDVPPRSSANAVPGSPAPPPPKEVGAAASTELTPTQIVAEINNARPYQQNEVAESFRNAPVSWKLYLFSIDRPSDASNKYMRVAFRDVATLDEHAVLVEAYVPIKGNEDLSMAAEGAPLLVEGQIFEALPEGKIDLTKASVKLMSEPDSQSK